MIVRIGAKGKMGDFAISSEFKSIDSVHITPHKGIDTAMPQGTPLTSIGDGVVENVVDHGEQNIGKGVIVQNDDGMRVIYGHIKQANVDPGQIVHKGDVIAMSGNTGHSTGPHLHLQISKNGELVDPTPYADSVIAKDTEWLADNPFVRAADSIKELNNKLDAAIDNITYWINPLNWLRDAWHTLEASVVSGSLDQPFLIASIVAAILLMLGAEWPKKILFWGWVTFWFLKLIFA